jgi:putative membrane protein
MRRLVSPFMSVATIVIVAAASPAIGQEPGSRQTREFVQAASQSDHFEILEADTALTESRDPQIRAFAQQMLHDHRETARALSQAARTAGLPPPPPGISTDQSQMLNSLQGLRGRDFDHAYVRQQHLAHRSALVVEQTYATSGDSPPIRQAAASTVLVIESHLGMIEQMNTKAGKNGSG